MAPLARASRCPLWPLWPLWPVSWLLLPPLLRYALGEAGGDIAVLVPFNSTGLLGGSAVLYCSLVSSGNMITQITWMKRNPDGTHLVVAVFHPKKGPSVAEPQRVRFLAAKQDGDLKNASLGIENLTVEDEGIYECQIATFPTGSRSANVWLRVLARPNNKAEALKPSPALVTQDVAKCTSADGHPPGRIFWPANVNGSHREIKERGSQPGTITVTSYFSMMPSHQADGKNITCRVEHESTQEPDQLTVTLSLPYPPEVSISGYDGNWHDGLTNVVLTCDAHSKPAPTLYEWNTTTGVFPHSAKPQHDQLLISTLTGLNNTIFVCKATNALGSGQGQVTVLLKETPETGQQNTHTGAIVGGVVFAILIALIVFCIWKHGCSRQSRPVDKKNYSTVNGSIQNTEANGAGADRTKEPEDRTTGTLLPNEEASREIGSSV
ncbi:poliovirus receptor-like [Apodemus sylvaticus]|uniref:poliovirus receptor-like n=1 Tax=Apodemus sylvaticus TaxID=10129 RepID=UPI0022426399|nr:poliovirus receptor-like [Apodemus sylvaticus]